MSGPSELGERLTAYHDRELSADEAAAVERLLAHDADAAAFVKDARAADALLTAAADAAGSEQFDLPALKRRVLDQVRPAPPRRARPAMDPVQRRMFWRGLTLGAVSAAALVMLAVTSLLGGWMQRVRSESAASRGPDPARIAMAPPEVVVEIPPASQLIPGAQKNTRGRDQSGPQSGAGKPEDDGMQEIPQSSGPVAAPVRPAGPATVEPPKFIEPTFVAQRPVEQPVGRGVTAGLTVAAAPVIRVPGDKRGDGYLVLAPPPAGEPATTPAGGDLALAAADLAAVETLRALRTSQNVVTRLAGADPLELAAWQQLVEQMDSARLLAELREAKARAADGPLRRCLATLEVILLRARHAGRVDARVAVQEAIRDSDVLGRVRQLERTAAAAGEDS